MNLKLDKNDKHRLEFKNDDGMLYVRRKMPFKPKPLKNGVPTIEASDPVMSDFDEIFACANGLPGLKEVICLATGCDDDVVNAVAKVLEFGLNRTRKRVTFPSKWRDVERIVEAIRREIGSRTCKVNKVADGDGKQTDALVFEDLRIPPLTAREKSCTFCFKKGSEDKLKPNTLEFDEALKKWFENNKDSIHAPEKFTKVPAEQPQIQCVDFTDPENKDVWNDQRMVTIVGCPRNGV